MKAASVFCLKARLRPRKFSALTARAFGGLAVLTFITSPVWAQSPGDAAMGAKLFLQCRACHSVGQGEPSGVGPNLYGVVGSKAASKPDFNFSAGLKASALLWSPANLDLWLKRPTDLVPTTKMAFAGVAAPKMREDLIAYLSTLNPQSKPGQ